MDYSIQQLTLIRQSIQSSVDYNAGGIREQPVIKVLNSEHLTSKEELPSLTVRDVWQDARVSCGLPQAMGLSLRRLDIQDLSQRPPQ